MDGLKKYDKIGFKIVPLCADSRTPATATGGLTEIYNSNNPWTPETIEENFFKFRNVATTFGKRLLEDGTEGYLIGFECDYSIVQLFDSI